MKSLLVYSLALLRLALTVALPLDSQPPNCLDGPRGGGPYPAVRSSASLNS